MTDPMVEMTRRVYEMTMAQQGYDSGLYAANKRIDSLLGDVARLTAQLRGISRLVAGGGVSCSRAVAWMGLRRIVSGRGVSGSISVATITTKKVKS